MRSLLNILGGFVLASGLLQADSITASDGTSWTSFYSVFNTAQPDPTMGSQGMPFWNNWSTDSGAGGSHDMNIGYMLSGSGGFAGTNVLRADSVGSALLGSSGSDPSEFSFTPDVSENYQVTLLGAYSGNSTTLPSGTQFGIYYRSGDTTVLDQLYGPRANGYNDFNPIAMTGAPRGATSYGFYATVCYGLLIDGVCQNTETFYTDSALNSGWVTNNPALYGNLPNYNHFAVFGLNSDNGNYGTGNWVIAFKDGPVLPEGFGDFNDVVIELVDPTASTQSALPEPATIWVVAVGFAGLTLARRRVASPLSPDV